MAEIKDPISKDLLTSVKTLSTELLTSANSLDKLAESSKLLLDALKKLGASVDDNKEKRKKLTAVEKEAERIRKAQLTTHAKLDKARSQAARSLATSKLRLQEVNKEVKNSIIESKRSMLATEALKGSYNAISKALSANLIKWKQLTTAERENSKEGKKLTATIKAQRAELSRLDAGTGNATRGVGKYAEGIRQAATSLFGAFGLIGGVAAFAKVLSSATKTVIQYSKANSVLASVLGKTKKEIKDLTRDSEQFGKTTQFTATQVAQLQTELAKLGFQQQEIRESTQAVLNFALAVDADLAPAAKVAGSTLRAMGLEASEMERVASVLAVATTKSALSFEDFDGNLSKVLPVAKSFGFTLEDTIALFGKLKDAGFDASSAVTATRNIFLNMADANGDLAKALGGNVENFNQLIDGLKRMNDEGFDLNETLKLTDKRSVAAFQQFLTGAESARTLRDSLTGVNDELKVMVETRTDNAEGAMKRLGSAWDGVVLKLSSSEGFIKNFLDEIADTLNKITDETNKVDAAATKGVDSTIAFWRANSEGAEEYASNLEMARKRQSKLTVEALERFTEDPSEATRTFWESQVEIGRRLAAEVENARNAAIAEGLAKRFDIENKSLDDLRKLEKSFTSFTTGEMKERGDLILPLIEEQIKQREEAEAKARAITAKANRDAARKNAKIAKIEADVEFQIDQDLQQQIRDEDQDTREFIAKLREDNIKSVDNSAKLIVDSEKKAAAERKKIADKLAKEKLLLEMMVKNATVDLAAQGAQAITDILLESSSQRRDEELDRLDEQREEDLERLDEQTQEDLANEDAKVEAGILTEEQAEERKSRIAQSAASDKARIEAESAAKAAEIKTRQAQADKAAALASAAINTAVGVTGALSNPATIPLIPFIIASGAIQAATILATPIPKFFKGTDSTPQGSWIAGDGGQEMIERPDGSMFLTPNRATLYSDMPGHKVITASKTKEMLAQMNYNNNVNFDTARVESGLTRIEKAVKRTNRSSTIDNVRTTKFGNRQIKKHESLLSSMKR